MRKVILLLFIFILLPFSFAIDLDAGIPDSAVDEDAPIVQRGSSPSAFIESEQQKLGMSCINDPFVCGDYLECLPRQCTLAEANCDPSQLVCSVPAVQSYQPIHVIQNPRIIHIGDSHVAGSYGLTLHQMLGNIAQHQETYGCSSAIPSWYTDFSHPCPVSQSPRKIIGSEASVMSNAFNYPSYLQANQFDIAIVSLGTNMHDSSGVNSQRNDIQQIVDSIGPRKCFWIGAPPTKNEGVKPGQINPLLQSLTSKCEFIDPAQYIDTTTLSGNTHFNKQGGQLWAQGVCQVIMSQINPERVDVCNLDSQAPLTQQPVQYTQVGGGSFNLPAPLTPSAQGSECTDHALSQIDRAWLRIAQTVGIRQGKIYDAITGTWKGSISCKELAATRASLPQVTAFSGSVTSQYDSIIQEAAAQYQVDPALLKAIIHRESRFNPNLISHKGCSGLMQICMGSANPSIIQTQCRQNRNAGPQFCNGKADDRFDPRKNIFSGAWLLRQKMNSVGNCGNDAIKAWISSYNLGQAHVKNAIQAAGGRCDRWSEVWNVMNANFDASQNRLFDRTASYLDRAKINGQQDTPNAYVGKVYASYLGFSGQNVANAAGVCFPLERGSFERISSNFGDRRRDASTGQYTRCHAGLDIYTKDNAHVVAMAHGQVVAVDKSFTTCEHNGAPKSVGNIMVYHPSLDRTINYGEIDSDDLNSRGLKIGQSVSAGQVLGRARYCDMLHLEMYKGKVTSSSRWYPANKVTLEQKRNICSEQHLQTKPASLVNPTSFISSLEGRYCDSLQTPVPLARDAFVSNVDLNSRDHISTKQAKEQWSNVLTRNGVSGRSFVGKISSNGATDKQYRKDTGRNTIIFVPSTVSNNNVELIYYFHGQVGFSQDDMLTKNRFGPQLRTMMQQNRNFVFVYPEMPWSKGTHANVNACRSASTKPKGRCKEQLARFSNDFNALQFDRDVRQTLASMGITSIGSVTTIGHSAGGYSLEGLVPYMQGLGVRRVVFSDSDYNQITKKVYDGYVKNSGAQLDMIVQHPTQGSNPHQPTTNSFSLMTSRLDVDQAEWQGKGANAAYPIPGHANIRYIPIARGSNDHNEIAKLSLAYPASGSTSVRSSTLGATNLGAQPTTCTYVDRSWQNGGWQNTKTITKPYSQLTAQEKGPQGCSVCQEDQTPLVVNGQVMKDSSGNEVKLCRHVASDAKIAIENAMTNGFDVRQVIGYRPGRTLNQGKTFSKHAYGVAIDFNRNWNGLYNKCANSNENGCTLQYQGAHYKKSAGGTYNPSGDPNLYITTNSPIWEEFNRLGWVWGGSDDWSRTQKDFMHFEKR